MRDGLVSTRTVRALLTRELTVLGKRMQRRRIAAMTEDFRSWQIQQIKELRARERQVPRHARGKWRADVYGDRRDPERFALRQMLDFLVVYIEQSLRAIVERKKTFDEFRSIVSLTHSDKELNRVLLEFSRKLGANSGQLRGDAKALGR